MFITERDRKLVLQFTAKYRISTFLPHDQIMTFDWMWTVT